MQIRPNCHPPSFDPDKPQHDEYQQQGHPISSQSQLPRYTVDKCWTESGISTHYIGTAASFDSIVHPLESEETASLSKLELW